MILLEGELLVLIITMVQPLIWAEAHPDGFPILLAAKRRHGGV